MSLLERHPPHVRRSIALAVTLGVAIVLCIVLIVLYTREPTPEDKKNSSVLKDFYTTILRRGQSSSSSK